MIGTSLKSPTSGSLISLAMASNSQPTPSS
jgi:hypothetical protein